MEETELKNFCSSLFDVHRYLRVDLSGKIGKKCTACPKVQQFPRRVPICPMGTSVKPSGHMRLVGGCDTNPDCWPARVM